MRATRTGELEKENSVLLMEMGRLRQMNNLLQRKLVARQQATDEQLMNLQENLAEFQLDRSQCICAPGITVHCNKSMIGTPQATLADLSSRSRKAHEALEYTVVCCKRILCCEDIDASSDTRREAMELLKALAAKHFMYVHH